jgi:hypothetical protein
MFPMRRFGKDKEERFSFASYVCVHCGGSETNRIVRRHAKTLRCVHCDGVHTILDSERSYQLLKP